MKNSVKKKKIRNTNLASSIQQEKKILLIVENLLMRGSIDQIIE